MNTKSPEEGVCFTADMQRVIVLPKLTTKEQLFVSRPVAFNEIFASKIPDILWHEAIAGRKAPDVASAFLQLIRQCNEHHIWLWADNCSGQNKKWYLFTGLAQCVTTWTRNYNYQISRKGTHIHESRCNTWKYQKTISETSTVATFEDFAQLCEKANNNIKTIVLDLPFIYPIFRKARTRPSTKVKIPFTESIAESQFKKEHCMLHYNESFFEESYTTVNFLKPFLRKML